LHFSEKISKSDIKNFQWTQKKYRDIYEIKAILDTKKNSIIKPNGISQIKIAQFEPNIVRVVFTDKEYLKTEYKINNNLLTISCKQIDTKIYKNSKKPQNVKKYISKVRVSNDRLIVTNSVNIKNIKRLKVALDNGQKLTIFQIDARLKPFNKKEFKSKYVDEIKVLRYTPQITRIVFADRREIDVKYEIKNNKIFFKVKRLSKKPVKVTKKAPAKIMRPNGKIIVIDPGHGGRDSGAIGYKKYQEKRLVFKVATKAKDLLRQRGYKVYLTRYKDKFLKLKDRTEYANSKNADIFVSIHANSIVKSKQKSVQGVETFFLSPSRSERAKRVAMTENQADIKDKSWYSKSLTSNILVKSNMIASNKLAIDVQKNMLASLNNHYKNVVDMGVRKGPFWILVGAQMPSILVEVGYITHPTEGSRLQNTKYQNLLAKGIADGIDSYFIKNQN
jgi:N-acetylmuramoyl-L-alanine amidase